MNKLRTFWDSIYSGLFYLSRSISFRICVIFFIVFIFLVFKVIIIFEHSIKKQLSEGIAPFLDNYLHQLETTLGTPIDQQKAYDMVKNHNIDLVIEKESVKWSSCPSVPDIKNVDIIVKKAFDDGHNIVAGFYQGRLFMRAYYDSNNKILILTKKKLINFSFKNLLLVNAFIIFFCIVFLGGLMIMYLINPIKKIQKGLKRIGNGEVSYRLPATRKDEIGQLSQSINQMASNIEGMLDSKRDMILGISHELRSPLTRVKLMLSLSEDSAMKEALIEEFDKMEKVIGELLESEKIKEGHQPLVLSLISVNDLIFQAQAKFFEHDSINLSLDDSLSKLSLDGKKMALVIKCLINNALSARKSKRDDIIISTYYEKDKVVISVKDFGVGICASDMKNIFKPFYRLCPENFSSYSGLGIGLHLANKIVEAHHGKLEVESQEGEGTTMKIMLPIRLN